MVNVSCVTGCIVVCRVISRVHKGWQFHSGDALFARSWFAIADEYNAEYDAQKCAKPTPHCRYAAVSERYDGYLALRLQIGNSA